ncbi:MAG: acyltransferase family protein [Caulobacter sp.]|nr:acyltransferase family protein [Caulobacter sp.]
MKYRADIDGLRAIAVLVVVGFHAGVPFLGGGFAGVDVFFVLSGYLIAGVIADRQTRGDFSLGWFWERRIRRIFPALMTVLAASTLMAAVLLLPRDFSDYAKSMAAALVSLSNVFFWSGSGYFAADDASRPLLHTWSLGVEEQFYFVFPVFMLLAARMVPGRVRTVLGVVAAASLALSIWTVRDHPDAAFYLPFTRVWELLTGVLLALWKPALPNAALRNAGGILGLAMIAASALLFSDQTPWPGYAALLPCLGAALLIAAEGGIAGRVLARRPMVWFGLTSYSLYLWHWPLLTFQRMIAPGPWATAATVLISILLAALSLRYVERPFRNGAFLTRRQVFAGGAAAMAILGLAAGAIVLAKGFPQRFDERTLAMGAFLGKAPDKAYRDGTCFVSAAYDVSDYPRDPCAKHDPARPDWMLVGDSHAASLWSGLTAANPDVNVLQATASGCSLALLTGDEERAECRRMTALIYQDLLVRDPPDGVLLAGRWREDDIPRIAATLDWAKARGLPVILMGPLPQYQEDLPRLLVLSWRLGDPGLPARRRLDWPREVDRRLAAVAREKSALYISAHDLLCRDRVCATVTEAGAPIAWDYGHLSPQGARLVADRLRAAGLFPATASAQAPSPDSR